LDCNLYLCFELSVLYFIIHFLMKLDGFTPPFSQKKNISASQARQYLFVLL